MFNNFHFFFSNIIYYDIAAIAGYILTSAAEKNVLYNEFVRGDNI